MSKSKTLSFKWLGYDIIRVLGAPGLLWFRPKKYYLTEEAKKMTKGGALMICNHISLFDPMYLMLSIWKRRHHFIAMSDLFQGKFKRWLFTKVFLCIEIDRNNFSMSSFREITNHLNDEELVTMFPEGHVNVNEEGMQAFKGGMVLMAFRSGKPIIPVYLKRRKHFYSRIVVGIGNPVNVGDFVKGKMINSKEVEEVVNHLQEVEHQLEELCENRKK